MLSADDYRAFDKTKQERALAVIALGFSERVAAVYAECSPSTLGNARVRDLQYQTALKHEQDAFRAAQNQAVRSLCEAHPARQAAVQWLVNHGYLLPVCVPACAEILPRPAGFGDSQ